MALKRLLIAAAALLLFAGPAMALNYCSTRGFDRACSKCEFTNGKIDDACFEGYKSTSRTCVLTEYPSLTANVVGGAIMGFLSGDAGAIMGGDDEAILQGCPAARACTNALKFCASDAGACPGNHQKDCYNPACRMCYMSADRCIKGAAADCKDDDVVCDKDDRCEADKGETKVNCCPDCGCDDGFRCKDGKCERDRTEETTTTTLSATKPAVEDLDDSGPGYLEDFCFSGAPFLFGLASALVLRRFP